MAWLTDWGQRIKLTIDHTKVDEDLLDFPVNVTLSSGTGITNANAVAVFSELTPSVSGTDSYTQLLLHMDDTLLSDSSHFNHVVTINDSVVRSAIKSKFGGYSAYFGGSSNDTLTLAESPCWDFGTEDWTIDFWIYRDGSQTDHAGIFSTLVNGIIHAYCIGFGTGATLNKIRIRSGASGSYVDNITSTDVIPDQTWTHIAFVRYGNTLTIYINGTYNNSINCTGYTFVDEVGYGAVIGKLATGYNGYYYKGYLEELRVSKGIARWTSDFSVSTQPYTGPNINKKIAITTENGTTQCYTEIEYWNGINQEATLWTKVSTVSSGTDTILYLYYDSTKADNDFYVGETGTSAAQNVWNSDFIGVFHLAQDPSGTIKNSTSVGIDASSVGSMTYMDLVDGKIGKAIDFDGSDDYLYTPSADDVFNITDTLTLECIFKPNITLDSSLVYGAGLVSRQHYTTYGQDSYGFLINNDGTLLLGSFGGNIRSTTASWSNLSWHYVVGTYNSNGLVGDLFANGVKETLSVDNYDTMAGATNSFAIGVNDPTNPYFFPGIIDEVRVSDIVRSDAWIKATYYSNWNSLITYGTEQLRPIFLFTGYVKVEGIPAARTVHLFKRSTGELMDSLVSDPSTGYFELGSHYNDYHFIVILPELTETYDLIAHDKIDPGV